MDSLPLGLVPAAGSSAKFATDGPHLYRYELRRRWSNLPPMVVIGLNPSIADATSDDPTIRRCVGFAKREGCGELVMVNLYAFVSSDPDDLLHDGCATDGERGVAAYVEGPANNHAIEAALVECYERGGIVLVAWGGAPSKFHSPRVAVVRKLIGTMPVWCLGTTRSGAPKHPLYLRNDAPLVPWSPK